MTYHYYYINSTPDHATDVPIFSSTSYFSPSPEFAIAIAWSRCYRALYRLLRWELMMMNEEAYRLHDNQETVPEARNEALCSRKRCRIKSVAHVDLDRCQGNGRH